MFIPALESQSSDEQRARWLDDALNFRIIGWYVLSFGLSNYHCFGGGNILLQLELKAGFSKPCYLCNLIIYPAFFFFFFFLIGILTTSYAQTGKVYIVTCTHYTPTLWFNSQCYVTTTDSLFIYIYIYIELGHGSNLSGLETTATLDKASDEWIINSPHVSVSISPPPIDLFQCLYCSFSFYQYLPNTHARSHRHPISSPVNIGSAASASLALTPSSKPNSSSTAETMERTRSSSRSDLSRITLPSPALRSTISAPKLATTRSTAVLHSLQITVSRETTC